MTLIYGFLAACLIVWHVGYDRNGPLHRKHKDRACPACGSIYDSCCDVSIAVENEIYRDAQQTLVEKGLRDYAEGRWRKRS